MAAAKYIRLWGQISSFRVPPPPRDGVVARKGKKLSPLSQMVGEQTIEPFLALMS